MKERKNATILIMERNARTYLKLFLTTLEISAFTFGGGYVIIPLMRRTFVSRLRWIEESEMLDLTAIAQSSPGPIAVNAAILIGYRIGGIPGAIISCLGAVIPPLVIISVISAFYDAFRSNRYVSAAMTAMSAGVAAVVADAVISMTMDIIRTRRIMPIAMLVAAFILVALLGVNIIAVIIISGAIGYLSATVSERRRG